MGAKNGSPARGTGIAALCAGGAGLFGGALWERQTGKQESATIAPVTRIERLDLHVKIMNGGCQEWKKWFLSLCEELYRPDSFATLAAHPDDSKRRQDYVT